MDQAKDHEKTGQNRGGEGLVTTGRDLFYNVMFFAGIEVYFPSLPVLASLDRTVTCPGLRD
jgi:hypothetical protein